MIEISFASDHEWIRVDEDGTASVGISEYAQAQLGDIVHLELCRKWVVRSFRTRRLG